MALSRCFCGGWFGGRPSLAACIASAGSGPVFQVSYYTAAQAADRGTLGARVEELAVRLRVCLTSGVESTANVDRYAVPRVFSMTMTTCSMRLIVLLLCVFCSSAWSADADVIVDLQRRGDAFVVEARIDVPVARRTAWDVLTDFDHMATILSNLTSSRVVARDAGTLNVVQQGTVRYGLFSFPFSSEREVRLEPMRRIVARQLSGTAKSFQSEMRLSRSERSENGVYLVHLDYQMEVVPDSSLARVFGASFIEHEVAEQLSALAAEMVRRSPR